MQIPVAGTDTGVEATPIRVEIFVAWRAIITVRNRKAAVSFWNF